jgi:hypothetical protein
MPVFLAGDLSFRAMVVNRFKKIIAKERAFGLFFK